LLTSRVEVDDDDNSDDDDNIDGDYNFDGPRALYRYVQSFSESMKIPLFKRSKNVIMVISIHGLRHPRKYNTVAPENHRKIGFSSFMNAVKETLPDAKNPGVLVTGLVPCRTLQNFSIFLETIEAKYRHLNEMPDIEYYKIVFNNLTKDKLMLITAEIFPSRVEYTVTTVNNVAKSG